jgi:hypothetical protein
MRRARKNRRAEGIRRLGETTTTKRERDVAMLKLGPDRANPGPLRSGANAAKSYA